MKTYPFIRDPGDPGVYTVDHNRHGPGLRVLRDGARPGRPLGNGRGRGRRCFHLLLGLGRLYGL